MYYFEESLIVLHLSLVNKEKKGGRLKVYGKKRKSADKMKLSEIIGINAEKIKRRFKAIKMK